MPRDDNDSVSDELQANANPTGTALALLVIVLAGVGLFFGASRFASFENAKQANRDSVPRISSITPVTGDQQVPPRSTIRLGIFLPGTGDAVDAGSIASGVRLVEVASGNIVATQSTLAADSGSITLTPAQPLSPGKAYRVEVTSELTAAGEAFSPYTTQFTVAGGDASDVGLPLDTAGIGWTQVPQADAVVEPSKFTALAWQPGPIGGPTGGRGDLFAGTADGRILIFKVLPDGNLELRATLNHLPARNGGPRLITGLAFDPRNLRTLWVSHGVAALSGADDFTGKLSVITGPKPTDYADRVVGLPRAFKDHLNFSLAFDPNDPNVFYVSQGSNTGLGLPDRKWNNRPERPLTAAILRVDTTKLPDGKPLDVTTTAFGNGYDPTSQSAAVTIHATGVRSGYDLLFHSSGKLLTAINGAGEGGNSPAVRNGNDNLSSGPVMNADLVVDDILADVTTAGGYHGHPNKLRDEFVLMGGNPTAGEDPFEITAYSPGEQPDADWVRPLWSFGKGYSINGLAESKAGAFGNRLTGNVFAARFSAGDDLVLLQMDTAGNVVGQLTDLPGLTGLGSPLNVLEDPATGNLYVTEFDQGRITLLRANTSQFANTGNE